MVTWRNNNDDSQFPLIDAHGSRHRTGREDEIIIPIDEYTSSQTLEATNATVMVDASSPVRITLPTAASHKRRVYTIKKIDQSGNPVTVDPDGTETIDGEQDVVLNLQYQYVTIKSDGDEWFIIGGLNVKLDELLLDIKTLLGNNKKLLQDILKEEQKANS